MDWGWAILDGLINLHHVLYEHLLNFWLSFLLDKILRGLVAPWVLLREMLGWFLHSGFMWSNMGCSYVDDLTQLIYSILGRVKGFPFWHLILWCITQWSQTTFFLIELTLSLTRCLTMVANCAFKLLTVSRSIIPVACLSLDSLKSIANFLMQVPPIVHMPLYGFCSSELLL